MTQAGSTTLGYDGRGNLTTSGTITYQYTSENRLAKVAGTGPLLPYDSIGRLVQIAPSGSGGGEINLDYQGGMLIAEHDQVTYALQRRYVHGAGVDEPLVWYEGSGTTDRRWLYFSDYGLTFRARAESSNGLYNHNITGRGRAPSVNGVGSTLNVELYTDGGSAGCI